MNRTEAEEIIAGYYLTEFSMEDLETINTIKQRGDLENVIQR